ncbi:MAG: SDR family NAD(P)-dependent oxidoreductase, partial [Caldilineaceae bacterium]|nr:SDR family NAD(P)-dependent oxidoreductase [Caldilineaceae bacterium]
MNAKNPFDLTGKVAIVTGASRGIGAAIAHAFAQAGAQVVLASRKQEPLDAVAAEIRAAGGTATAVAAHTGDDAAVEALVARAVDEYGGVDILVNNAATNPHYGPVLTAEDTHWDKTFDVNVKGYVRMVRACMAPMQARGGGAVINVASIAG